MKINTFMKKNSKFIILILLSIIINIFLSSYIMPRRAFNIDQLQHFYDMNKWYKSNKLPTTSARFIASKVIDEEYTTPRVPGGAYYIFYTLFYKLSGEKLLGAKIINLIFNLIIISIFLFWFYKKFGLISVAFISPLILCNGYFILSIVNFWNPSLSLIFSFIFFIFLFEYIDKNEEDDKRKIIVRISAVFLFPILAVIAQGHFFTFFSAIPTLIIYLIIRYKRTLKYFKFFSLGVFISFILYLPYLISELQNNFNNLNMIFTLKESLGKFTFPQIHFIFLFPTNEMSFLYGTKIDAIINFWKLYPFKILGISFLFISVIFSFACFCRALYFYFNKKYVAQSNNEKNILEMFTIFLLFIPITIIINLLAGGKIAVVHYLYSIFALSYIPIILFFIQFSMKNNNKFLYIIYSMLIINIFVISIQLITYINNYEKPMDMESVKLITKSISELEYSDGVKIVRPFDPVTDGFYNDFAKILFPEFVFNENSSSSNILTIINKQYFWNLNSQYASNYINNIKETSRLITNNSLLYLYKSN